MSARKIRSVTLGVGAPKGTQSVEETMRQSMLGIVSCALALSVGIGAAEAAESSVKYSATRAIAVDRATGNYRKPNAAEIEKLVSELKAMTRQPVATAMTSTARNTGGITAKLDKAFGGVVLARPRADGSIETRCVFTFEEGAEFLGLVASATK
jgi:hypothetical protein